MSVARNLGSRLIGSLRNENLICESAANLASAVYLCNSKGDKWAMVIPNGSLSHEYAMLDKDAKRETFASYADLIAGIKAHKLYPAPKVRTPKATPKVRHTTMTGVSMARFQPGYLSAE